MIWNRAILRCGAAVAALMFFGGVAGAAKPRAAKPRVVEVPYSTGLSAGVEDVVSVCFFDPPASSCVLEWSRYPERFVSVEVIDASGLPVPAWVGPHDEHPAGVSICGSTSKPVEIFPGAEVEVVLNGLDSELPCPGLATTGVVRLEFSSRP